MSLSRADGVACLQLERPDRANAIDGAMAADLRTAAEIVAGDASVRVLAITGRGQRFSAGGDVGLLAETAPAALPALLGSLTSDYHVALRLIAELPVPVVCGVHGAVAGGALGLLYASDIVIAAAGTKFVLGFGRLGLTMDGGNTWYLPRLVGQVRALQLYLDDTPFDAGRALELGLVSEVVAPDDLGQRVTSVAARLAAGPTAAYGQARRLLRRSWEQTLEQQLADESRTMQAVAGTADAAAGMRAFARRRPPEFTGQ